MAEVTGISWTHSTFNPWSGCSKVSDGCKFCYAAALPPGMRRGADWGAGLPRVMASPAYWNEPLRWEKQAAKSGQPWRVFCASTADVFENRDDLDAPREQLAQLIERTPHLTWLLVTKRASSILQRAPVAWRHGFPKNVWVLVSVENQQAAEERIPYLLRVPAVVRGLSMEPLLGPATLSGWLLNVRPGTDPRAYSMPALAGLQWIITGGESGSRARPMDLQWVADIHRQARAAGVAIHHKQMGSVWAEQTGAAHTKGGDPNEWPESFRIREFPEVTP